MAARVKISSLILVLCWAELSSALVPTSLPSPPPTLLPTLENSTAPTLVPTTHPTTLPTLIPSQLPTSTPTVTRTQNPTQIPSLSPTTSPTTYPSPLPTVQPSKYPTGLPTLSPTPLPTIYPTHLPTSLPTPRPSRYPTGSPTAVPSPPPTPIPFPAPSSTPTERPTGVPTPMPFPAPSSVPIPAPSAQPTPLPTARPTHVPTPPPTQLPTILPTPTPSHDPTPAPSEEIKEDFPVLIVVASVGGVLGVVLLALLIRNTDCISKFENRKKVELFVGDKVTWWSHDAEIPKGAVGEILEIDMDANKANVRFESGEFALGLQTLNIAVESKKWWWDNSENEAANSLKSKDKDNSLSIGRKKADTSSSKNNSLKKSEEEDEKQKIERRPSWTAKNYTDEEYGQLGDKSVPQQGMARKISFSDKQKAKSMRSFTEFLGRGHIDQFASKVVELGYLDVKSFVAEIDQSEDVDISNMLQMNSDEVNSLRKLSTLYKNLFEKKSKGNDADVIGITQKLDRSLSFKGRSMSLEMNMFPVALDEVVRSSLSRPDDMQGGGGSLARQGSLTRQGSLQRSASFSRLSNSDDEPGSPLSPEAEGGRSALRIRANSLIRSESMKRSSNNSTAGASTGPVRRPSGVGKSNLRRPSDAQEDMGLLARANSLIRGESYARNAEPSSPNNGLSNNRSRSNSATPTSEGPPPSSPLPFRRMNSRTRNDSVNRTEAIESLRQSESSMSFNFFSGGSTESDAPPPPPSPLSSQPTKPQRRRSRSSAEPSTPKTPIIPEETVSNFMTPLSIFDSSSQSERTDASRGSFTDFFTGMTSAEPKEANGDGGQTATRKAAKSTSKAEPKERGVSSSNEDGGGRSRLAEAKSRRTNSLTVDTGRSNQEPSVIVGDEGPAPGGGTPTSSKKLSTLQKHQQLIALQHIQQRNSPRTPGTARSVSPATPGTSI